MVSLAAIIEYTRLLGQYNFKRSATVEISSAARAIVKDDAIVLVVPGIEFWSLKPNWRATAFVHQGDFGINPPPVWSGDLMPPVKDGLSRMK